MKVRPSNPSENIPVAVFEFYIIIIEMVGING